MFALVPARVLPAGRHFNPEVFCQWCRWDRWWHIHAIYKRNTTFLGVCNRIVCLFADMCLCVCLSCDALGGRGGGWTLRFTGMNSAKELK